MTKINKNLFSPTLSVVKRGTATMLCVILSGLFLVAGCKKDPVTSGGGDPGGGEEPEYPMNIPFTEYVLAETCQWQNLAYNDKVIIINSDEQLRRYVACTGDGYPEIDFAKQTLLLANGSASSGVSKTTVNYLQQLSELEYELDMELLLDDSTAIEQKWTVALIVEKVNEESMVELKITEYPINILFEEYSIFWAPSLGDPMHPNEFSCWEDIFEYYTVPPDPYPYERGKVSIINNNEELEHYLICPDDYPVIDFSKHTLVVATGFAGSWPTIYNIVFLKTSTNQYTMKTEILVGSIGEGEYYCIAILTPKIEDEATVRFMVNDYILY